MNEQRYKILKELADLYGDSYCISNDIRNISERSLAELPIIANHHIEVHTELGGSINV